MQAYRRPYFKRMHALYPQCEAACLFRYASQTALDSLAACYSDCYTLLQEHCKKPLAQLLSAALDERIAQPLSAAHCLALQADCMHALQTACMLVS